jgi:hypothetical protein
MKHSRIAAGLLGAALLAAPIAGFAQGYPYGDRDRPHYDQRDRYTGVIAYVNGGAFKLRNGRTVFLHNGTVINPTGVRLQPGMRVSVFGRPAGDGNINANEVDIAYRR